MLQMLEAGKICPSLLLPKVFINKITGASNPVYDEALQVEWDYHTYFRESCYFLTS